MSQIDDPSRAEAFLGDEEVQKLRVEAGVVVESHEMLSMVNKFKIWQVRYKQILSGLSQWDWPDDTLLI